MRCVLAPSDFSGVAAVGGVAPLGAQLGEHPSGSFTRGRTLLGEALSAVLVAVPAPPIGKRSPAVPAGVGERDELGTRVPLGLSRVGTEKVSRT